MKNKKSLFALFLAVCLVFTLAACNGNGSPVDVMQVEEIAAQEPVAPVALPETIEVPVVEEAEEEEEIYVATPVVQLAARPAAPQTPVQPEPPVVEEPEYDTYEYGYEYDEPVTLPCEIDPDDLYECEEGYCECDEAEEPGYECEEADEENGDDYYNNGDDIVDEEKEDETTEEPPVAEPEKPVMPESDEAPVVEVPDAPAASEEE